MTNVNNVDSRSASIHAPDTPSAGEITAAFRNLAPSTHPALRNIAPDRQVAPVENLAPQIAGPTPGR